LLTPLRELLPGLDRAIRSAAVLALLRAPVLVAVPLSIREIFDHAIPAEDGEAVVRLGVVMLVLYVVDAVVLMVVRRRASRFAVDGVARVRHDLVARLYALPRSWHDAQDAGLLHAALVHDCERMLTVVTQLLGWLVPTAVTFVVLAVVAAALAPLLAAVAAVVLAVLLLAVIPMARSTVLEGRKNADALRRLSSRWRSALRLLAETQAHGAQSFEVDRSTTLARTAAATAIELQFTQSRLIAAVDLAAALLTALTLAVGGVGITQGWISIGAMLSFAAVGLLVARQLSSAAPGVASGLSDSSSVTRLVELLAIDVAAPYSGRTAHTPLGGIELDRVSFAYVRGLPVLQDVSLSIESGEHVVVLGPNGAGKSTLVNLVLGAHRPNSGTLRIDGIDMDELDIATLRRGIGLASQDAVIFAGSIADNIAYASPEASRADVERAAKLSTADQFLAALPDGVDTLVGEEGVRLSGGQRQRVALARALLGAPRLVILDEPTTYLDAAAVDELLDRLELLPAAPTVLMITHDSRIAERADRVIHLRDGRVVDAPSRTAGRAMRS
jgi:ATP-binding cassette subfamily B protein